MNRFTPSQNAVRIVLALFVAATIGAAYLSYRAVRDLVFAWRVAGEQQVGGFEPRVSAAPADSGGEKKPGVALDATAPLQGPNGPPAAVWDGSSRVTGLVMGVDHRDWLEGGGPPRTDTMLVVSLDPAAQTLGMLSLPRDLWVAIPGYDYGKINTAYPLGEIYEEPGGGPGLALATVEQFLGIDIDFYAQLDFNAFVQLIDEIGGLEINVPAEITVDPVGGGNHLTLSPGWQTLDGAATLAYVRARNTTGGDFDRAQRQQQALLAARQQIVSLDLIPVLITKAPILYQEIAAGVQSNLSLEQVIRMGLALQQIPSGNIQRGAIGAEYVTFGKSPEGQDILKPIPDKIRLLRDDIFAASRAVNPVIQQKTLNELIREEAAQVALLNGTQTPGLAARTAEYLTLKGIVIGDILDADDLYPNTTVIDYTGNPYTLQFLVDLMKIQPNRIFHSYDPESAVDLAINLGKDWAESGLLP